MTSKLSLDAPGSRLLLLGNEAIARGAIEAGVGVATAYPGTPSTEIVESLAEVARGLGMYVEWSVSEKVAFEVALGAAMCGVRALTAMKHVGLNVAMDPLMSSAYTGVVGGFVVVTADDPSCHSSQNEQDNRLVGLHAYIPVMEPYCPAEAKEMTAKAFEFSERLETPVLLRTTTRVSHTRGPVTLGPIAKRRLTGTFHRDPSRWVLVPAHARVRRRLLTERWKRVEEAVNGLEFNRVEHKGSKVTVVASGIAYAYVREVLKALGAEERVNVVKVATPVPVPRKLVVEGLEGCEAALVVEELEPLVEWQVKRIAFEEGLDVDVHGKDLVPIVGELSMRPVVRAIARLLGLELCSPTPLSTSLEAPSRPPTLCPGCPHRATFFALKRAVRSLKLDPIYANDIGCYTLGLLPPYRMADTTICMGASIGLANGIARVQDRPVIAIIGDSTFFHAGFQPLVNAVYNDVPLLVVVVDNRATAMTGHQPHPGTGVTAMGERTREVRIEEVAKAVGVEHVVVLNPFNLEEAYKGFREALRMVVEERVRALVVSRGECMLLRLRRLRRLGLTPKRYRVLADVCTGCRLCVDHLACPAISMVGGKARIDPLLCTGCGVCSQVCPVGAIVVEDA